MKMPSEVLGESAVDAFPDSQYFSLHLLVMSIMVSVKESAASNLDLC